MSLKQGEDLKTKSHWEAVTLESADIDKCGLATYTRYISVGIREKCK